MGWTLDNRLRRWLSPAGSEVDRLTVGSGHHVVDLGAGVGFLGEAILERLGAGGRLDLVEPDPAHLTTIRERFHGEPRVQTFQASAAHVPFLGDATVDRVVLSLVLCCMVEKEAALDETWRILRPGGLALVSYPEFGGKWTLRKRALRVTPALWARLVQRHPWTVRASSRERFIRRHLLEKPH
jgi:ubiquinone/menaquinone biosynthesis C-methylase UbiE